MSQQQQHPSEEIIQSFANLLAHGMIEYSDLIDNGFDEIARELMVERSKSLSSNRNNNRFSQNYYYSRSRNSEMISKRMAPVSELNESFFQDHQTENEINQHHQEEYFARLRLQEEEELRLKKEQKLKLERQIRTESHLHKNNQKRVGEDGDDENSNNQDEEDESNVDENVKRMMLEMMMKQKHSQEAEEYEDLRFREEENEDDDEYHHKRYGVVKTHEDDVVMKQRKDLDDEAELQKHVQQAQRVLQTLLQSRTEQEDKKREEYLQNPNCQEGIKKKFHRNE
jgi:hypothetical protein